MDTLLSVLALKVMEPASQLHAHNFSSPGFIETENNERSIYLRQHEIVKQSDLATSSKVFKLDLSQFGPYSIRYNFNGKRLLIGGARGHLASFDWISKKLLFEVHIQDRIRSLTWLHDETMLAVSQKEKVFIYDINGVELHRIKYLHESLFLDFLPHHFLLVAARKRGSLTYFDTSMGVLISDVKTHTGTPSDMCYNPQNGVVTLGHTNGNITMWSPKQEQPIIKMICHRSPLTSVSVDYTGNYMATCDMSRFLKIWDMRTYSVVSQTRLHQSASHVKFSQRGLLGLSYGNRVDIYKDVNTQPDKYLRHNIDKNSMISSIEFCPYEDVLGIGHTNGFISMVVPGSGEANIDSLIPNPYQTVQQRKEYGVRKLLEKIQPEMISLEPNLLTEISKPLKTKEEVETEIMFKYLIPKKARNKKSAKATKQIHQQIHREKKRIQLMKKMESINN